MMKKFTVMLGVVLVGLGVYVGCGSNSDNKTIDVNISNDINQSINDEDSSNDINQSVNDEDSSNEENKTNVVTIDFKITHALNNQAAYVTSQCYTKTEDSMGNIHNPCFACHVNSKVPNYINDLELQTLYDMSQYSKVNRFTNLFKDRTQAVSQISDEAILTYIRENNYKNDETLLLAKKLQTALPTEWDVNENGKWDGYMPDCYFSFDNEGFDKNPKGDYTGWRAFGYYPFLGTFWPTNGSTDDVLIRLPKVFREDSSGNFNLSIYKINLAIVESLIKKEDVQIEEIDERLIDTDLNQDGILTTANVIKYHWVKPSFDLPSGKITNFSMTYVGKAKALLATNEYLIAPGLYPKGTEFLHSVRYIDSDDTNATIKMASRMKELRYAKKTSWASYPQLQNSVLSEIKEADAFPERLRTILGNSESGVHNGIGWVYQGFIEDAYGTLRPQNYEESIYCVGCHSGIGATTDSSFAYPRKFYKGEYLKDWYHWSQDNKGLKGIKEPIREDGRGEYRLYLEQNNAGDEFRNNDEVINTFFNLDGSLKEDALTTMHEDISHLLYPSTQRALMLNKAYKVIVDEQSFIYGRDTHMKPVENVHKEVEEGQPTGITNPVMF